VPPTNLALFYGYQIPGEEVDGRPLWRSSWEGGCPHAIWVNKNGERFCDESFYKDYQPRIREWDGKKQEQPNTDIYLLFDGNYRERYPLGSFMPGMEIPEELAVKADTPRELAEKLGIDPARFEATLERFNAGVRAAHREEADAQRAQVRAVGEASPIDHQNPLNRAEQQPPQIARRIALLCAPGKIV